jgi:hypothetical protein
MYSMIFILVFLIYQTIPSYTQCAEEGTLLNVNEILKNVDTEKYTKAQIKEYYDGVRGKKAKGEGIVVNVLPGKRERHKVTILTPASSPEKGYNVVLYTTQDAPSELNKNDKVVFEGEVGRLSTFRGSSIDIHGTYKKAGAK